MTEKDLHPQVREFKAFINRHPKLIESIRKSGRSWQEYYEKWTLLGEDDPYWNSYKSDDHKVNEKKEEKETDTKKQTEMFEQLKKLTETVDLDKIQKHAYQLSGTINTIQELIGQFQDTKKSQLPQLPIKPDRDPSYDWFKD
ncbi:YlbD family protein [Lentibacillus saliphilus]|uniref:YlbD family protein n=1 Tax=Lentibacillus saliphilus TaxID=2737028 RepID=UPI001C2F5D5C|nr:YlbD family protein [Lentibacillus saliphilus]